MNKKEMFKIMCKGSRDKVIELATGIEKKYDVKITKKPAKTLVMLKMRETAAGTKFYLGELLACEATVEIDKVPGMAITAGDDFDKVLAMAVIDAAFNAGLPETKLLNEILLEIEKEVIENEKKEFGNHLKSKVDFRVMEGA
jgi:alpha-D-ribose 1-methylphosphonate 5-triphosphate synthase subunit PhnG